MEDKKLYSDLRSKIIVITEQELTDRSIIEKKAYAEAAFFLMNEVCICEKDIFAGRLEKCNNLDMYPRNREQELSFLENGIQKYESMLTAEEIGLFTRAPGAHAVPAYDILIQEGIQKRIDCVKDFMLMIQSEEKKCFYISELLVLYGMQKRILRYAKEAGRCYKIYDQANIKRIQESCEWIAYNPPRSFHEAIQLVLLAHEHILSEGGSGSISFGRLDQYLYPFYEKDLRERRITKEDAQEMIIALWRKISEYEMGWQNVTLGGSNQDGKDMCNDLTILCMNASLAVRGDQPQVSLRVHKNMPQTVWKKAFELIQTGMGFPELYNDDIAVKAKMNADVSEEDAWNYSIVGCVELSSGGKEYSHTEGARFNWLKILELMLHEGRCSVTGLNWKLTEQHALSEIKDFQEFYEWYKRELKHFTECICVYIDELSQQYPKYWPVPTLSSMMQGCIETGRDVTDCGSIYNNLTVDCVGIASVADSLEAIETLVFKEGIISLNELSIILEKDFEGFEAIQEKMHACPKYGNDISSVDHKVKELVELFVDTLSHTSMKYRRGRYQAGFYTSYFHATMGMLTGASPDGRKAKEALSSSLSPMAGMDKNGPTAVVNSANHINMERFSNGTVLDLKFTADFFVQEKHRQAIQSLIEEYFEEGGMEIQFNALDRETLLEAKKNPLKYGNLLVRVSGFSAYFVALEESLQDEIIRRTEHKVS